MVLCDLSHGCDTQQLFQSFVSLGLNFAWPLEIYSMLDTSHLLSLSVFVEIVFSPIN